MPSRRVTAREFWQALCSELQRVQPRGYGTAWTTGMYEVLHGVQRRFRLWCQCGAHASAADGQNREMLEIDFTWFAGENDWDAPVVAIEHENSHVRAERAKDHWRVNQVAAPLRVFIGYVGARRSLDAAAAELREREARCNQVVGGEALLLMGYANMDVTDFRAWSCLQGEPSTWRELPFATTS